MTFKPIHDDEVLSHKIISQITDNVVQGRLKPGDKLPPERELAEQFRVSRTVIRDAVKTLAGRGLLQVKHGRGIFIATAEESMAGCLEALSNMLGLQDTGVRDLFEVRKVLETRGAELAAEERRPQQLDRLRKIVEDAYQHLEDVPVLSKRDAQFHVAVAEASQNLVLMRIMLALLDLLAKVRLESLSIPGRGRLSLIEHEQIIEAIEAQDPYKARQAMLDHLNSVEEAVIVLRGK